MTESGEQSKPDELISQYIEVTERLKRVIMTGSAGNRT